MRSRALASELGVCVLICTYNNAGTLRDILQRALIYAPEILVINDGSTDDTAAVLASLPVRAHHLTPNGGKGNALHTGMRLARDQGFNYVITLDSDGQHFPEDIPYLLEAIHIHPQQLIIGSRNMGQSTVPGKSSFGNKFSNFWFGFFTGIHLPDTQSGYRVYPLSLLERVRLLTTKYEFEVEVLVRSAWQGYQVRAVPVRVYYPPGELRVSHFRPFRDFARISVLNTVLFFRAFFYEIPRRWWRELRGMGLRGTLRKAFNDPAESPLRKAAAVGFGVFMGIFPVWGYQLIIGWSLCMLLRLNKVLFTAAAHISIPPMIPLIIFGSYLTGSVFMPAGKAVALDKMRFSLEAISLNLVQYLSGAVLLATVAGLLGFLLSWGVFERVKNK